MQEKDKIKWFVNITKQANTGVTLTKDQFESALVKMLQAVVLRYSDVHLRNLSGHVRLEVVGDSADILVHLKFLSGQLRLGQLIVYREQGLSRKLEIV